MEQPRKPYDQAFKFLAEQDAEAILFLVGALPEKITAIETLPPELSSTTLIPDQLYLVTTPDEKYIVHIEAQTYWDAAIPQRMSEYALLLWLKYRLPVMGYVLVLSQKKFPLKVTPSVTINAGYTQITTRFQIVRLWEIPAEEAIAQNRSALLPFVPLMRGDEALLNASAQALQAVAGERLRLDLSMHFIVLASLRYNYQDIFDLIGSKTMIYIRGIEEAPAYQAIFGEGRQEGRQEAAAVLVQVIQHLATRRFSGLNISSELEKISDLNILGQICEEVPQVDSAETLVSRIKELSAGL